MSHGRIEAYVHSDRITANKAGVLVKVTCQSEQGARTEEFKAFCARLAKLACGYLGQRAGEFPAEESSWDDLVKAVGYVGENTQTLETERLELQRLLKEEITVVKIASLSL